MVYTGTVFCTNDEFWFLIIQKIFQKKFQDFFELLFKIESRIELCNLQCYMIIAYEYYKTTFYFCV